MFQLYGFGELTCTNESLDVPKISNLASQFTPRRSMASETAKHLACAQVPQLQSRVASTLRSTRARAVSEPAQEAETSGWHGGPVGSRPATSRGKAPQAPRSVAAPL
eukprot:gnl/TRDRNA2_/TRDRNA2_176872_c14_seq48.p1 gnl/TRDRNA2_/TRDRNA2_176872_c14~~gnl/TRDRNA2_/TRDRNA2_176872_c14_seq48.p1  ORF type:complete len:107 (-),score=3.52 gnl/TRDRNA2_/TRDRNA2_176872_c14_seq48:154-474(-)